MPCGFHRPECLWGVLFKMATTTKEDDGGVERGLNLSRYVKQNSRRNELLDFVSRDFSEYAWSLEDQSSSMARRDIHRSNR